MKIDVLCHSSIKIETEGNVIYSDPFRIKNAKKDADIIVVTHSHYDHFSEEDILKVKKENTKILITKDLLKRTIELGFNEENITVVMPNNSYDIFEIKIDTIPAYNIDKKFHPKENNWVGYILGIENKAVYVAGDTDVTEENESIECDIALVPIGGTYTMNYKEAAKLINKMKPQVVIPTHYGEIVGNIQDGNKFNKLIDNNINVEIKIK